MADKIKMEINFFQVPNEIFDLDINIAVDERKKIKGSKEVVTVERPLKTYEKLIYIYLCRCGNNSGQAFPSYNTIAEQCSINRRTAIEGVANLIKNGLLEKKSRTKKCSGEDDSNIYFVLNPKRPPSEPGAPPSEPSAPQGSEPSAPPSDPGAPKKELYKKNYIKKELIKYSTQFLEWYSLYPNPWNKEQSFKNFKKLLKEESFENLIAATKNYIAYLQQKGATDKQYITRSTNFIGQKKEYLGYLDMDIQESNEDWRL